MVIGISRFLLSKTNYVWGLVFLAIAGFIALALLSYTYSDPSFNRATNALISNLAGKYGAFIADPLLQLFGISNIFLVFALFCWGMQYFIDEEVRLLWFKIIMLITTVIIFSALTAVITPPEGWIFVSLGGYIGFKTKEYFLQLLPLDIFIYLALIATVVSSYIALGINKARWRKFLQFINKISYGIYKIIKLLLVIISFPIRYLYKQLNGRKAEIIPYDKKKELLTLKRKPAVKKVTPKLSQSTIKAAVIGKFNLPSVHLLEENKDKDNKNIMTTALLRKSTEDLMKVLADFGVSGEIIDVHTGPVVTLYELEPAAGTKSSRVIGLADDISRSMKSHAARIAVIPGRNAIGIELPNKKREIIYLRELLESEQYKTEGFILPLVLGRDIAGRPIVVDLTRMPHLLVAGTTGSGKSVSINTMILSLLYALTPEQCKLIMIDPKMLELSVYDDIPHLLTPVVTDPKKAIVALKWVVKEMEERYRMMSNIGVRSIAAYNNKIAEAKDKNIELSRNVQTGFDKETGKPIIEKIMIPMRNLPFIVVIVDEMADLMLVAGKEIETSIQRLSQMARAAGIHIIMATQRPSVDVITGVIKANFPTRISFHVTSRIDSRTILGEQGAEQLLGMGDMLYMGNGSKIIRVHGPYVADDEVRSVVEYLKSQGDPEYIDNVTIDVEEVNEMSADFKGGEDDELYNQAMEIVIREKKASTSYIQRCLRIGYNRAASIIERMEKEGVVSAANHVGKREVLYQ